MCMKEEMEPITQHKHFAVRLMALNLYKENIFRHNCVTKKIKEEEMRELLKLRWNDETKMREICISNIEKLKRQRALEWIKQTRAPVKVSELSDEEKEEHKTRQGMLARLMDDVNPKDKKQTRIANSPKTFFP